MNNADGRLERAYKWAAEQEHGFLMEACFLKFQEKAEWPQIGSLQRNFELEGISIDIASTSWLMPAPIGFVEGGALVLRLRALNLLPVASDLMDAWHRALILACTRWLDEEDAVLRSSDLEQIAIGDHHQLALLSQVLLRESWAFGGGTGDHQGIWSREIHPDVRIARGTGTAGELIRARDQVEFPVREPAPLTLERPPPHQRATRLWNTLSHHPVSSTVLSGLLLAALLAAAAKILG